MIEQQLCVLDRLAEAHDHDARVPCGGLAALAMLRLGGGGGFGRQGSGGGGGVSGVLLVIAGL
jgi:hypothetical protein